MFKTEQENFWATEFGDDYTGRNSYEKLLPTYIHTWSKILDKTNGIKSCIEFGANIGINLMAIKTLLPKCELSAIEINHNACEKYLSKFLKGENINEASILQAPPFGKSMI